jgi:hypothetical protein
MRSIGTSIGHVTGSALAMTKNLCFEIHAGCSTMSQRELESSNSQLINSEKLSASANQKRSVD